MEVIEYIFKLILFVGGILIFGYLLSYITGGISKLFGTTMVKSNGRVISTPTTIDENIQDLKILKERIFNNKKYNQDKEQARQLEELQKLQNNLEHTFMRKYWSNIGEIRMGRAKAEVKAELLNELEFLRELRVIEGEKFNTLKQGITGKRTNF